MFSMLRVSFNPFERTQSQFTSYVIFLLFISESMSEMNKSLQLVNLYVNVYDNSQIPNKILKLI